MSWADSSFLVSLHVDNEQSDVAKRYLIANPSPITISAFTKAETQHAFRLCAYRGMISEGQLSRALATLEHDQNEGLMDLVELESESLFTKAGQLSGKYALTHGARFLDVLHVAGAVLVKSRRFLTFDQRQAKLAKSAGLEVRP